MPLCYMYEALLKIMFDIAIIGAGVVGCAIARELSKYHLKVCIIEKENDVACGTSKANSGIVHAGYDAEPGTLKAKLNVEGSRMFDLLSSELQFEYKNIGSLVLAFDEEGDAVNEKLLHQGFKNGVQKLELLYKTQVLAIEPNISDEVTSALYAPTAGITCPYEMTWALAENAVENGVELFLNHEVTSINKQNNIFTISAITEQSTAQINAIYVVNAAGLFADRISLMAGAEDYPISARRGEYSILDKNQNGLVNHVCFATPTSLGKGVLVTPTVDGNILIGPTAEGVLDKEATDTSRAGQAYILSSAKITIPILPQREIINSYAGLRAISGEDFIIEKSKKIKNFINVLGICSPGLTSAPAIGLYVKNLLEQCGLQLVEKDFNPYRKGITKFRQLNRQQQQELIQSNPLYGHIVCRCESVTEAEIVKAIHSLVPAVDLDGVKRRVRAGMGRCQSGFCSAKITAILAREMGISMLQVTKSGKDSLVLRSRTRADD